MSELEWATTSIKNIVNNGLRLEASFYNAHSLNLRENIAQSQWGTKPLAGPQGFTKASYPGRFKRVFVEHSDLPIFRPSQITDLKPAPDLYLSDKTPTDLNALRVKRGQILMTRSGTVGIVSLVSESYNNQIFSDDLLRIDCESPDDIGYIYAFLKSDEGQALISTNNYGAVIKHIEPTHLEQVKVPNLPHQLKGEINTLIVKSYESRDRANELIDQAESLLVRSMGLPPLNSIKPNEKIDAHQISIKHIADRFEATYHSSRVEQVIKLIQQADCRVLKVQDSVLSESIVLPGRFKRVYVNSTTGVTFFGGKQIYELNPSNKKYLSTLMHDERIKDQLTLRENMILVTCSGTIGKVQLTPEHWSGWTINQHVLRIIPQDTAAASIMYIWLQSGYGQLLIKRFSYGAVVDEIDDKHIGQVPIPVPNDETLVSKINSLVMQANRFRAEAYNLEQKAIDIVKREIYQRG